MLAYTKRLGVTGGKVVVITTGHLELARSMSTVQFLQRDFFMTSSATAAPSRAYLRCLAGQEDGVNTTFPESYSHK